MGFAGGLGSAEPELRGGRGEAQWVTPGGLSLAWGCLPQGAVCGDGWRYLQEELGCFFWGGNCGGYALKFLRKTLREKLDSHPGIAETMWT